MKRNCSKYPNRLWASEDHSMSDWLRASAQGERCSNRPARDCTRGITNYPLRTPWLSLDDRPRAVRVSGGEAGQEDGLNHPPDLAAPNASRPRRPAPTSNGTKTGHDVSRRGRLALRLSEPNCWSVRRSSPAPLKELGDGGRFVFLVGMRDVLMSEAPIGVRPRLGLYYHRGVR